MFVYICSFVRVEKALRHAFRSFHDFFHITAHLFLCCPADDYIARVRQVKTDSVHFRLSICSYPDSGSLLVSAVYKFPTSQSNQTDRHPFVSARFSVNCDKRTDSHTDDKYPPQRSPVRQDIPPALHRLPLMCLGLHQCMLR